MNMVSLLMQPAEPHPDALVHAAEDARGEPSSVRAWTVTQVAERYGCKPHLVLKLIAAGELVAIDLRLPGARRPRWKILPEALAAFEQRRAAKPQEPVQPRRRRKQDRADQEPNLIDPETGRVRRDFGVIGTTAGAKQTTKLGS